MDYAHFIRELGRGRIGARDLSRSEAQQLYGAMLDGDVPELELGAIAIAWRVKGESLEETLGFLTAINERLPPLAALANSANTAQRVIVIPTYNGARKNANLTPLLALLLARFRVPVLVHGLAESYGRVTSGQIFAELGVPPCSSLADIVHRLDQNALAYAPLSLLLPGLENLLNLRRRLGLRNSAHSLVKMFDPFHGNSLLLASATHPAYLDTMRDAFSALGTRVLLLRGTEGEAFANPTRCPRIEYLHEGVCEPLVEAEHDSLKSLPNLPEGCDAPTSAEWTKRVLAGEVALPNPLAKQLAACLYACGRTSNFEQATALVAAEWGA